MSVGQAVGQLQYEIYHYRNGVRYQLEPLVKIAENAPYSESYIRFMVDTGLLIGIKIGRDWFVDKSLIKQDSC